jgi:hypothetical protein
MTNYRLSLRLSPLLIILQLLIKLQPLHRILVLKANPLRTSHRPERLSTIDATVHSAVSSRTLRRIVIAKTGRVVVRTARTLVASILVEFEGAAVFVGRALLAPELGADVVFCWYVRLDCCVFLEGRWREWSGVWVCRRECR